MKGACGTIHKVIQLHLKLEKVEHVGSIDATLLQCPKSLHDLHQQQQSVDCRGNIQRWHNFGCGTSNVMKLMNELEAKNPNSTIVEREATIPSCI